MVRETLASADASGAKGGLKLTQSAGPEAA